MSKQKSGDEKAGASKGKRSRRRKGVCLDGRPVLEPDACWIDIGAREIFAAVPPDQDENPVRVFSTFTEDLEAMARWLVSRGVMIRRPLGPLSASSPDSEDRMKC